MLAVLVLWLGCAEEPPPPPPAPPTVAVVVPLTGANAPMGESAVQGVALAVDDAFAVQQVDENAGDPVAAVQAIPNLVGVVGHVSEGAADRFGRRWVEARIPTVLATSSMMSDPPHVLPDITQLSQCSLAFIDPALYKKISVYNDGAAGGMAASVALESNLRGRLLGTAVLDATQVAREAERIRASRADLLVWVGSPDLAGNLVRTMRLGGGKTRVFGIGMYDPHFLEVAGGASNSTLVTTGDRPGLDGGVVESFQQRFGQPPAAPALNAYDAAKLLRAAYEVAVRTKAPDLAVATRENIPRVQVQGSAGVAQVVSGTVMPVWCTGFFVQENQFQWKAVAKLDTSGTVALATELGVVPDPSDAKPATTVRKRPKGDAVILR